MVPSKQKHDLAIHAPGQLPWTNTFSMRYSKTCFYHGNSCHHCLVAFQLHSSGMQHTGLPIWQIMELSGISKTAVHKTIHNFKECGSFKTKAWSSHLCSWTATLDCYLQHEVLKNPFLSSQQLSASLGSIPVMQLQKAAYWAGINCQIAPWKLFLTAKNWHKHL